MASWKVWGTKDNYEHRCHPQKRQRKQGEPNTKNIRCAKRLHAKYEPRGPPRIGGIGISDAHGASRVFVLTLILAQLRPPNEGAEPGGPIMTNKVTGGAQREREASPG